MEYRRLSPGQRSELWVGGPELSEPRLLFETNEILIEAPNWSVDGRAIYVNGNGKLWTLDVDNPTLVEMDFIGLPEINNDHVLCPRGEHIYLTAVDKQIYRGELTGGCVERVTLEDGKWHYLHGVSPDGGRLAYVELDESGGAGKLAVISSDGDDYHLIDVGDGHLDGPEWSPDGNWLYFNTEAFANAAGHAQIARIPSGGGEIEQLLVSNTVDWFPHLSPNGLFAVFLSFPAGTIGHPSDLPVVVKVVDTQDWTRVAQKYSIPGGQGTINVNSWAPDSSQFAFIAYPSVAEKR